MIYDFVKEHWDIFKWVALGIVILEAAVFLLALMVRAANQPVGYNSDDEFIVPRQQIRQPLLNRPPPPATGVPVSGVLDQRPSRSDAWSTRMREKVPSPRFFWHNLATSLCYHTALFLYRHGIISNEFIVMLIFSFLFCLHHL
ncbi:hypothetical protein SAY86_021308 [Trapa natans]|uniref:Tobamovirus multiplication protein 2A n=1 Tax=Trapa natans TaxID=22666 RepID=A0AAN7RJZ5_TRANT|nr:hypothetical protein SAY86_021308 [Trapa natans]